MRRRNIKNTLGLILPVAVVIGCGGVLKSKPPAVTKNEHGDVVYTEKAKASFKDAVDQYKASETAGWTENACKSAIKAFQKVESDYGMSEAAYNIGVVYRKCKMMDKAKETFNDMLKKYPKHQLAMTHLAVMELEKGNEQRAEDLLRKAVGAGQSSLEAVPAYVNAATLLRLRGKKNKSDDSFKKAEMNLRRALAIESKYMPALYQLAMLYLDQAVVKNKSSFLTLALLVCSQGIKLNPEYGPIYHVYGMVLLQKNRLVDALKAFETAFQKDSNLFASYMNFGAINLNFRGYQEAKTAFEKAIALDPKSYEAHIGLGVALRGLGDYAGAKAEYKKASEIDPKRTDYIFNVGVLEMDYLNDGTVAGYKKAKAVFQKFLGNLNDSHRIDPDGKGPLLSWEDKAKDRVKKCDKNVKMIREAEKEMAEMERLAKEQAKREAEMKAAMEKAKELEKKEAEGAAAPEEGAAAATTDASAGANSDGATGEKGTGGAATAAEAGGDAKESSDDKNADEGSEKKSEGKKKTGKKKGRPKKGK